MNEVLYRLFVALLKVGAAFVLLFLAVVLFVPVVMLGGLASAVTVLTRRRNIL